MKPKNIVDGWNAWFFDDLNKLKDVWPYLGENRQSVGTLWLGFLDYYARCFDDKNEVVCIRQSRPLSKFEKMWNSPCIAIEDPFDLSHNLGAGISRKMNLYIKKAFVKTRNHFGFLPQPLPCHYKLYLFDPKAMADGSPPNDRGCRACGKIGHLVRDCPRNKKNNEDRKKREHKEHMQVQERQRKESLSKDAIEQQMVKQEKKQLSKVEKTIDMKKSDDKTENLQALNNIKVTKARLQNDDTSDDELVTPKTLHNEKNEYKLLESELHVDRNTIDIYINTYTTNEINNLWKKQNKNWPNFLSSRFKNEKGLFDPHSWYDSLS